MDPNIPPDFRAEVRFLTTEEGGRSLPLMPRIWGGYIYRFPAVDDHDVLGEPPPDNLYYGSFLLVEGDEVIQPGETARISIISLSADQLRPHLEVGMPIQAFEGGRLTAEGSILEILHPVRG